MSDIFPLVLRSMVRMWAPGFPPYLYFRHFDSPVHRTPLRVGVGRSGAMRELCSGRNQVRSFRVRPGSLRHRRRGGVSFPVRRPFCVDVWWWLGRLPRNPSSWMGNFHLLFRIAASHVCTFRAVGPRVIAAPPIARGLSRYFPPSVSHSVGPRCIFSRNHRICLFFLNAAENFDLKKRVQGPITKTSNQKEGAFLSNEDSILQPGWALFGCCMGRFKR